MFNNNIFLTIPNKFCLQIRFTIDLRLQSDDRLHLIIILSPVPLERLTLP